MLLSWSFVHLGKWLDKKLKINFKVYDVINLKRSNYNKHISRYLKIKDNQTMTFRQLVEYMVKDIFLWKSCRKWGREISTRQTSFYFLKSKWSAPLIYFGSPRLKHTITTNCINLETIDSEIFPLFWFFKRVRDYLLHHILCMIFSRKISKLNSLNSPSFIAWLSLLLGISGNIFITCLYLLPAYDVINFGIFHTFLVKSFSYMTKK